MDYRKEYEKWLASPALSAAEKAEGEGAAESSGTDRYDGE